MKNIDPTATPERKTALKQICDAESYLPIIEECLDESQRKSMRTYHMANFLSLSAELFLLNYDGIAQAFERNNGLEIIFKAKLATEKDLVDLQYKPVEVFKDSASANLPIEDPNQPDLFKDAKKQTRDHHVVEEEVRLKLPSPAKGLPAPALSDSEKAAIAEARSNGFDARSAGSPLSANPHPFRSLIRAIWKEGWNARDLEIKEGKSAPVVDAEIVTDDAGGVEIVDDDEDFI